MRSNDYPYRQKRTYRLPSTAAPSEISRRENRENIQFPDQQLRDTSHEYCGIIPAPLESGVVLKWIKQHLRIKSFYGTSDNAVKSQIWIAISVYLLVAIIKKRLKIEATLYTIITLLSITIFEKKLLDQLFTDGDKMDSRLNDGKQLNLFDDFPGH